MFVFHSLKSMINIENTPDYEETLNDSIVPDHISNDCEIKSYSSDSDICDDNFSGGSNVSICSDFGYDVCGRFGYKYAFVINYY